MWGWTYDLADDLAKLMMWQLYHPKPHTKPALGRGFL